jgi:hypothetical protein
MKSEFDICIIGAGMAGATIADLPISAAVLLGPRLVLGEQFANNIQLNLFLLRQIVNIIPMVLSLMLLK